MLRNFKYIIPIAFATVFVTSCKKGTFDINVDPNNPSTLPVKTLLPGIEASIGSANELASGISSVLEVYMHRITVRESPNGYGIGPGDFTTMWDVYYQTTLTNANIIVDKATADGNLKYAGIAKLVKAFAVSQLVDVYGDVPYTEANNLLTGVKNPKFDDDATIYPKLLSLIDEAIANLKNTTAPNPLSPGTDDVIYGGDITKWIKLANTLKLKLYTQERLVTNVSTQTTALLADPTTLLASGEDFSLPHSAVNKNAAYSEYSATQRTKYISPWFYEVMKGYNTGIFTGNVDPRIPYYFYNQVKAGQVATNDGAKTEYRDGSFISIIFDSDGPNSGFSQQTTLTTLGLYPAGGLYDDGAGVKINSTSATGAAPFRILTYADELYLKAELIKAGVVTTGDARATLLLAIQESFKLVDAVKTQSGNTAPALAGTTAANNYIAAVMAEYDANPAKQLQIILTQKWIQGFGGNSVDAYNDYRRTGFPKIFNPNDYGPASVNGNNFPHVFFPPANGNPTVNPQPGVPVSLKRPFSLSIYWPSDELDVNSSAPAQKDPSTYKVFWQP